jgi:hypothetical protein
VFVAAKSLAVMTSVVVAQAGGMAMARAKKKIRNLKLKYFIMH